MSLALITQPVFLRTHFAYTRQVLLGVWPQKTVPAAPLIEIETLQDEPADQPQHSVGHHFPEITTILSTPAVIAESFTPENLVHSMTSPEEVARVPLEANTTPSIEVVGHPNPAVSPVLRVNNHRTARNSVSLVHSITKFVLTVIMVVSLGVGAVIVLPEVYYTVFSKNTAVGEIADAAKLQSQAKPLQTPDPEPYMPPQNPDLPSGTWMSIPRIGVYSEMYATLDENEALDKGIWLVPDFGRPGDTTQPIIAAAHRFGWDWWWQSDYWKYNSFYLLTETEPGDRVEIIYDQRKWVYEIYAVEEGELITDYDADLILYTCKFLNSPIRYFRYAKLITE